VELIHSTHGHPGDQTSSTTPRKPEPRLLPAEPHAADGKSAQPKHGGELARLIDDSFGGIQALKTELVKAATAQFGSGWVWLVRDGTRLKVMKTSNAEVPFTAGYTPVAHGRRVEHVLSRLSKPARAACDRARRRSIAELVFRRENWHAC
jgi:hypothetical protein